MIFNAYAKYYDLFYKEKDYEKEVLYIHQLIKSKHPNARTILDLGCGTGKHANEFSKLGYDVTGIDLSSEMILSARENYPEINFLQGNLQTIKVQKKFDVVVALFHVMSYQTSNEALSKAFENAYAHLHESGLFIFDCWHGEGVLHDPPEIRTKHFNNHEIEVTRISSPQLFELENLVKVNFEISVKERSSQKTHHFSEVHNMRYLFKEEIQELANMSQFRIASFQEWLQNESSPITNCWNVVAVLKK